MIVWRSLQLLIITSVCMSDAIWGWNDSHNPYVPPAIGVMTAWLVTWILSKLIDLGRLISRTKSGAPVRDNRGAGEIVGRTI
jgi:hypothetical protein